MPRKSKRRSWTSSDVRTLKTMARRKTRAASIARTLSALRALRGKRPSVLGYLSTRVPKIGKPEQRPLIQAPPCLRGFLLKLAQLEGEIRSIASAL